MTVKLVGSTSGSVSLQAPASTTGGAHRVLTLPDADGTVATTTTAGKILQVVQTVKSDRSSYDTTSFVDIAGMTASITPSSSSNKILVTTSIYLGAAGGRSSIINFVRGSTNIAQPTGSSVNHQGSMFSFITGTQMNPFTMTFLDSHLQPVQQPINYNLNKMEVQARQLILTDTTGQTIIME